MLYKPTASKNNKLKTKKLFFINLIVERSLRTRNDIKLTHTRKTKPTKR